MLTILEIKGMTCAHCTNAVKKSLAAVAGVNRVIEVSKDRGEAIVDGDANPALLIAAIIDEGYEAKVQP